MGRASSFTVWMSGNMAAVTPARQTLSGCWDGKPAFRYFWLMYSRAGLQRPFHYFADASASPETIINYQILTGLIAIVGHIFPLFAGFRGGKGVATTFGFLLALSLPVTLICLGVFLAVLLHFWICKPLINEQPGSATQYYCSCFLTHLRSFSGISQSSSLLP
jgi:hypothetical protein